MVLPLLLARHGPGRQSRAHSGGQATAQGSNCLSTTVLLISSMKTEVSSLFVQTPPYEETLVCMTLYFWLVWRASVMGLILALLLRFCRRPRVRRRARTWSTSSSGGTGRTSTVPGCPGRTWSRRRPTPAGAASGRSCRPSSGRRCMAR